MRAYATQVEVLRRLRSSGQQFMRVEHVHVNDGGQAVIGNVKKPDAQPRLYSGFLKSEGDPLHPRFPARRGLVPKCGIIC
jgi:hypothetical protein